MAEIEVILKIESRRQRRGHTTASCTGCYFSLRDEKCPTEKCVTQKSCIKSSLTDGDKEIIFVEVK